MIKALRSVLRQKAPAELLRGGAGAFAVGAAGQLLVLIMNVAIARILGASSFGVYSVAVATLAILTMLASLGLDHALVRFIPALITQSAREGFGGLLNFVYRRSVLSSIAVAVAGLAWIGAVRDYDELTGSLILTCLIVPFSAAFAVRRGALRGLKAVITARVLEALVRPIFLLLLLAALSLAFGEDVRVEWVVAAMGTTLALLAVLSGLAVRRHSPQLNGVPTVSPDTAQRREWSNTGFALLLGSGALTLLYSVDIVMLGGMATSTEAGYYSVSARLAMLIIFGLNAVQLMAAPLISEAYTRGDNAELQKIASLTALFSVVASVPVVVVFSLWGRELLSIFGDEFVAAYPVLLVLVVSQLINSTTGATGTLLANAAYQKQLAAFIASALGLNIALNLVLIPHYGAFGAAISAIVSHAVWNIVAVVFIRFRMQINSTLFFDPRRLVDPRDDSSKGGC